MFESDFQEGAKVVSLYADVRHFPFGENSGKPITIGTVGPVSDDGWADVTWPDGYRVLLNAERCDLVVNAPNTSFQSISGIKTQTVLLVYKSELVANWTVAANQAAREGLHGTAERLRNDIKKFKEIEGDFTVEIVA